VPTQNKKKGKKGGLTNAGKVDPNQKREKEELNAAKVAKEPQVKVKMIKDVTVKVNEEEIT
jgi:hypothetical protein